MSTQSYAPDRQATSQQATGRPATSQQGTGPSWFQIWAMVIGTAVPTGPAANPAVPSAPSGAQAPGASAR
jgi:hypothetical protein